MLLYSFLLLVPLDLALKLNFNVSKEDDWMSHEQMNLESATGVETYVALIL